jgi:hypothetical protein
MAQVCELGEEKGSGVIDFAGIQVVKNRRKINDSRPLFLAFSLRLGPRLGSHQDLLCESPAPHGTLGPREFALRRRV